MALVITSKYGDLKKDIVVDDDAVIANPAPTASTAGTLTTADATGVLPTAGTLTTGECGDVTAINDGEFAINIDAAGVENITGLNFTGASDLDDVAGIIQTALQAVGTGGFTAATCVAANGRLVVTSGTKGALSAVSAMTAVGGSGTDVSGLLEGLAEDDIDIAAGTEVDDGEFTVSIDGDAEDITGLDFSAAADVDAVAAAVEAALQLVGTGGFDTATCVAEGNTLVITSGTTGAASTVSVLSAVSEGSGTDVSALLGGTAEAGASSAPGTGVVGGEVAIVVGADLYARLVTSQVQLRNIVAQLADVYREAGSPIPVEGEYVVVHGEPADTDGGASSIIKGDIVVVLDSANITSQLGTDDVGLVVAAGFADRAGVSAGPSALVDETVRRMQQALTESLRGV